MPLLLSRQVAYCMNSSWQVFFTLRKKSMAQPVTARPSARQARGSSSSCRQSINSCKICTNRNVNKWVLRLGYITEYCYCLAPKWMHKWIKYKFLCIHIVTNQSAQHGFYIRKILTLFAVSHCLPKWKEPARSAAEDKFSSCTFNSDSSGSVVLFVMTIV